jgi:hypothetical protein
MEQIKVGDKVKIVSFNPWRTQVGYVTSIHGTTIYVVRLIKFGYSIGLFRDEIRKVK